MSYKIYVREEKSLFYFLVANKRILSAGVGKTFFEDILTLLNNLDGLSEDFNQTKNFPPNFTMVSLTLRSTKLAEFYSFNAIKDMLDTHPELFI